MFCNRENKFIDSCTEFEGVVFDGKPEFVIDFTDFLFCNKCEAEEEIENYGGMYGKMAENCGRTV